MKKLIAKTTIGAEFFHSKENSFFASANAEKIVKALNDNNYLLNKNNNEIWHVYDYDFSQDYYCFKSINMTKNGSVKVKSSY
jgi:hypothetical protein